MKTSALAATAFVVVALWLALAAAAPLLAPFEPLRQDIVGRLAPPSGVTGSAPTRSAGTS